MAGDWAVWGLKVAESVVKCFTVKSHRVWKAMIPKVDGYFIGKTGFND